MKLAKLFAIVAVLGLVGLAQAKDKGAPKPKSLQGVVKSVDAANNKVVVTVKDKDQDVTTDANTKVIIGGENKTLADLKAGDKVSITPDTGVAAEIKVAPAGGKGKAKGGEK
jgi:Cu/Ag efflux protein CusF